MFQQYAIFILLVTAFVKGQDCPSNPDVACIGCDAGFSEPTFTETTTPTELDHVCDITLSWDEQVFEVSPRMTFTCSYDDGSLCYGSEEDVCASCGNVTFAGLNSFRFPMITYSDTCGNIEIFPVTEDCQTTETTTPTSGICRGVFEEIGGKCLFVDPFVKASWDEGRFFCSEFDADLANLDSDQVYLAVLDYIYDNSFDHNSFWVGASDRFVEGSWRWLNGEIMTMGTPYWATYAIATDLYRQEPYDLHIDNVDCVQMDASRFLYYNDEDCRTQMAVICEKNFDLGGV